MAADKAHTDGSAAGDAGAVPASGAGARPAAPASGAGARPAAPAAPVPPRPRPSRCGRNLALFAPVALVWVALDLAAKAWFNQFPAGTVVGGPIAGLVRFRVAHNTGGAWGMFGDATVVLGVLSLAVCAGLLGYVALSRCATAGEALGAALVFAGGLGNAIDRFTLGYVVDFIDPVFIDFPTFNIADIGVTCGFVIFFAALFLRAHREEVEAR